MKRDLYWDSLKFVLIFFVVYGHIIAHYSELSRINMATYNFIYLFHMPLFVFVSGRFSHIRDKQKYKKGILRLLETFIVFQIIRSSIPLILGGEFTFECFYIPNWILWYLVALIYWRLMVYYMPTNWFAHRKRILILSFCISLLAGFVPVGNQFVVQRTLSFLPFFVMGYYSTEIDIRAFLNKIPPSVAIGILLATFLFLYFFMNYKLAFVHHCSYPYWEKDFVHTMMRFRARCFFIPSTIILGAMIMRLVPTNKTLAKWGSITMFIYVYHSFALRETLYPLMIRNYLPYSGLLLFIYSIVITASLIILSRTKFFNILLNPITYWEKK